MTAGLRLFAERGFRATTVGDIEAAAGLQPRRGALYNHFQSKQALLEAAVEAQMAVVAQANSEIAQLSGGDVRSEMMEMGRWFLTISRELEQIVRIIEKDGDRLPKLRETVRATLIEAGHRAVETTLKGHLKGLDLAVDTEALAAVVMGPLANQRRVMWTFGSPPLGVDDERLLHTWSETFAALAEAAVTSAERGIRPNRRQRGAPKRQPRA